MVVVTSPDALTFASNSACLQVLGHLKTCLVLGLGYLVLQNPFSWRNVSGILVALLGMVAYSYVQIQEARAREERVSCGTGLQQNYTGSLWVELRCFTRSLTVFLHFRSLCTGCCSCITFW